MADKAYPDVPGDPEIANKGEQGQGLAEYAIILALIAAVCVGALTLLGQNIAASVAWTIP